MTFLAVTGGPFGDGVSLEGRRFKGRGALYEPVEFGSELLSLCDTFWPSVADDIAAYVSLEADVDDEPKALVLVPTAEIARGVAAGINDACPSPVLNTSFAETELVGESAVDRRDQWFRLADPNDPLGVLVTTSLVSVALEIRAVRLVFVARRLGLLGFRRVLTKVNDVAPTRKDIKVVSYDDGDDMFRVGCEMAKDEASWYDF